MPSNSASILPASSEAIEAWLQTNPPLDAQREMARALERQRVLDAQARVIDFVQYCTPTYNAESAHRLIAQHLDAVVGGTCKRLIIVAPRRHGKSFLASEHFPAYWLMHHPDQPVILASYASTLAETFSRRCRDVVSGDAWSHLTPLRLSKATSSVSDWQLQDHRGGMIAAGVGSGITGKTAGLLLADDLYAGWAEAYSETVREHTWEWYGHTFRHPLVAGGAIVIVSSRWHEDDVIGRILANQRPEEPWTVIRLPAMGETQGERDARNKINGLPVGLPSPIPHEPGEPLCPLLFGREALDSIRYAAGMSPQAWESEYQGAPTAPEGSIIKKEWLRYYVDPPAVVYDSIIASWDCSFKDADTSDYVVGVVLARKGARIWLLDMVRERMDFPATCKAIKALRAKWPSTSLVLVEDAANGTAVVQALRDEVSHMFEAGQVYFPEHAAWLDDAVHELTSFPAAAHDDVPDALSQGLSRFMDVKPLTAEQEQAQQREDERIMGIDAEINRIKVAIRTTGYPQGVGNRKIAELEASKWREEPPPESMAKRSGDFTPVAPAGWAKPRAETERERGYVGRRDGK
jgi:hypothetical protein